MKAEVLWAITGKWGLYTGTAQRRTDMIAQHVNNKKTTASGIRKAWAECKREGDRCIRVEIRELPAKRAKRKV